MSWKSTLQNLPAQQRSSRQHRLPPGVTTVVVVSDTHCGCQYGLYNPRRPVMRDVGGGHVPSRGQRDLWALWERFSKEWLRKTIGDKPFALVLNGDILDGRHHRSITQITQNLADQQRIAHRVLDDLVSRAHSKYFVRGTPAHVGEAGENEERLAEAFGAIPDEAGQRSRWELWLRIGKHLAHFSHHIGISQSLVSEATALVGEYNIMAAEAAKAGRRPADIIVRSHRHRHMEVTIPTSRGHARVFVTPAWQLTSPFAKKVSPTARVASAQIGASVIQVRGDEIDTAHFVQYAKLSKPETL